MVLPNMPDEFHKIFLVLMTRADGFIGVIEGNK